MEDTILNFDKAQINFKKSDASNIKTEIKQDAQQSVCVGELFEFEVAIPLSKCGREQLKIPHPPRSPASSNMLKCFMRHVSSTLDVKTSIIPINKFEAGKQGERKLESPWHRCPIQASHHPERHFASFKAEPYITDNKTYIIPFQMRLKDIPSHSDRADLMVEIKQGQRLGPDWLSSPTRPDPLLYRKDDSDSTNRLLQRIMVIHPPEVKFQHKTVAGKQLILLQAYNNTSHPVSVEDCYVMPESCPVKLCKHSIELQSDGIRKPCLVHGNMVKLVNSESPLLPVQLLPNESVSLMFSLHFTAGTNYLAKEEIPLLGQLKWHISAGHSESSILTAYSLPTIKVKQAHFVMSASCKEDKVQTGDSFTVTYCINNRLQDFLSIKLYWNPAVADDSLEEEERILSLTEGLLCCDPQVQLGACPYGSVMEAQVRFQALRPGLYEVCKHMKINLRYLIPSESDPISSPSSHFSSQSGDDRLTSTSEEIWRERSGSGSSYKEREDAQSAERRLSLANKSYSVGDLVDKIQSPKSKTSEGRKLLLSSERQSSKYEQMLLNPGNFLKNSCEVYVTPSRSPKQHTVEEETLESSIERDE